MSTTAEFGLGPMPFPRGWFMAAPAEDIDAKPQAIRLFGQDLALYRGKSGKAVLLDAYCPHMGTHLTKNTTSYVIQDGQIEGDSIRCPYHAWRFGPDGKCDHIPYYDGPIPKAAAVRSWPVVERAGIVFVWHDPEGGAPDYELPAFAEWDDPTWIRWQIDRMGELPIHPQEIVDNLADGRHLGPTHGAPVEYFHDRIQGHICVQHQGGRTAALASDNKILQTDSWYHGPGVMISSMTGEYDTQLFIAHTPVEDGSCRVWHALMVRPPHGGAPTEADRAVARAYGKASRDAFAQDFEIWQSKIGSTKILQIPTDGPFHKTRLWYSQFFHPRAEAAEIAKRAEGTFGIAGLPQTRPPEQDAAE